MSYRHSSYIYSYVLILFLFSFSSFSFAKVENEKFIENILPEINKAKESVGGLANDIPNSLIIAQAILESKGGKSKLARKNKNIFGLKKGRKYGNFSSLSDCLEFYLRNYISNKAYSLFVDNIKGGEKDSIKLLVFLESYAQDKRYKYLVTSVILENNLKYYDV